MISTTTTIQIIFMIGSILLMLGLALFTKTVYAVGVLPFIMMISPFVFQCVPKNLTSDPQTTMIFWFIEASSITLLIVWLIRLKEEN